MPDRTVDVWGERTPHDAGAAWPHRVDQHLSVPEAAVRSWVPSACMLCGHGCGLEVAVTDGRVVGVRGRRADPVNHGRLGPKGLYGWQANNAADRLTDPLIRIGGELRPTDWATAMDAVAARSREILDRHGPLALAFYGSAQLLAEEQYALAVIARAGVGTPHLDTSARVGSATAGSALAETFGSDGNPGSYRDIDHCDTLLLVGHDLAETETVLWSRVLDRRRGSHPPRLVVVDPRRTPTAREADVHLAVRPGTHVALLNAIQHELIHHGWTERDFLREHTVGYPRLAANVADWTPEWAAEVCGVDPDTIRAAARVVGTANRLVSTVADGVHTSPQATAAAVQVNNVHLLRGMVGRPGCTVLHMTGQPAAQNAREAGVGEALPGFRNWRNPSHLQELAEAWNVPVARIPHWAPASHVMDILRHCEDQTVRFLWVSGTNPAVTLPDLHRVRSVLGRHGLFLVVSDAFRTETAELADVVLPTAMWAEKTGCHTATDRTVHLSEKAVEPPGAARADFDVLLDYARRMDFRDRDDRPLLSWTSPEQAWTAFTALTSGRGCDQSALTYDVLRETGGVQWPCTPRAPRGTERLYTDHVFATHADTCQDYGHDLATGAPHSHTEYRAHDPAGRAVLKAARYLPPHEAVEPDYPLVLVTGRTVHHWQSRAQTGRVPELDAASPDGWIELCSDDAVALDIADGDLARVMSRHGAIEAPVRCQGPPPGVVFAPFHYGYFDQTDPNRRMRAAHEVTHREWDPVSKQPVLGHTPVRVEKVSGARRVLFPDWALPEGDAPQPGDVAPAPETGGRGRTS